MTADQYGTEIVRVLAMNKAKSFLSSRSVSGQSSQR